MPAAKIIIATTLLCLIGSVCVRPAVAQERAPSLDFSDLLFAPSPKTSGAVPATAPTPAQRRVPPGLFNRPRADVQQAAMIQSPLYVDPEFEPEFEPPSILSEELRPLPRYRGQRTVSRQPNCQPTCDADRFWVRADYLYWSLERAAVPALITTSPIGTDRSNAGILGRAGTTVLLGNEKLGDQGHSGLRLEFGSWIDQRSGIGWHVAYFGLDDSSDSFRFNSDSTPILARPFYSIEPSSVGPNAELISLPNQLEGNVNVSTQTSLDSAELMLHWVLHENQARRLQFMAGYQYGSLEDDLTINDFKRVTGNSTGLAIGTTLRERDRFQATNEFHGAAFGVQGSARLDRWRMDLGMQMALGNNYNVVRIDGSTTSSVPIAGGGTNVVTTPQGLLALNTNSGSFSDDTFTVIPQLNAALGYDLTDQARLWIGYRFLYWSQVVRAGEQIDTGLNLSQLDPAGLTGEPRPIFDRRLADFIAQGLTLGLDYRF